MDRKPPSNSNTMPPASEEPRASLDEPTAVEESQGPFVDLVAYLDGELSAEQSAEIELRLANDPVLRERLAQLQKTWDLLGTIPATRLDETFTQSTVELVATRVDSDWAQARKRLLRSRGVQAIALSLIVAGSIGIGYGASRYRQEAPNRQLLDDLPVIERVDMYRNAQELEFLVRLAEEGLFDESMDNQP